MLSRLGCGATATGAVLPMQPDSASAVTAAMIGRRNARATRTGAIPQSETAPVLHRLWLTIGVEGSGRRPSPCESRARDACLHHAALTPTPIGHDTPVPPRPQ